MHPIAKGVDPPRNQESMYSNDKSNAFRVATTCGVHGGSTHADACGSARKRGGSTLQAKEAPRPSEPVSHMETPLEVTRHNDERLVEQFRKKED